MSPSPWQLLIVLAIVLVLFGAKRLRNIGSDLGGAVKGFRQSMREGDADDADDSGRLDRSDDDAGDHRFDGERDDGDANPRR